MAGERRETGEARTRRGTRGAGSAGPARPDARRVEVARRVLASDDDLGGIAEAMGMTVIELAELIDEPAMLRAFDALRHLTALRNECFLGRYRVHAVARLVAMASASDDGELARKAAVDLLKIDLGRSTLDPPVADPAAAGDASGACGVDRGEGEAVLAMLARLGGAEGAAGGDAGVGGDVGDGVEGAAGEGGGA